MSTLICVPKLAFLGLAVCTQYTIVHLLKNGRTDEGMNALTDVLPLVSTPLESIDLIIHPFRNSWYKYVINKKSRALGNAREWNAISCK